MIPQYKTILYTTNLMPKSRPVLRHAIGIAQHYNARIHIVHVVPEMDPSHQNYLAALIGEEKYKQQVENLNKDLIEKIEGRLRKFIHEELQDNPAYLSLVAGIDVLHGPPTDQILTLADKLDADLLVFGSHDKDGAVMELLGNVVKRVLRRTRRPVLVVPVVEEPGA